MTTAAPTKTKAATSGLPTDRPGIPRLRDLTSLRATSLPLLEKRRSNSSSRSLAHARQLEQKAIVGAIPELRALTREEPAVALQGLQERMARLGVAVVYVAEFDGCRASGAIWWASPEKAVVLLSNRGKREDRFWFSFFHELGHLVHHAKRDTFIDQNRGQNNDELPPWVEPAPSSGFIDDGSRDSLLEEEADEFASVALIPRDYIPQIAAARSAQDIRNLADWIGVSAGIVAGRYQYETGDYKRFNPLRRKVPHKMFTSAI